MIAPIIDALQARQAEGGPLRYRLVHTGQHYNARMSGDFFVQLSIPQPEVNLEVGSGTRAEQTGVIMTRYENDLVATGRPLLAHAAVPSAGTDYWPTMAPAEPCQAGFEGGTFVKFG